MYKYPYGNMQQLNLDWFLTEWEKFKQEADEALGGIDGALQTEIDRVEAAMTDLYAARDAAIAARDDARDARSAAADYAISSANSAASSARSAQSSSQSATNAAQRAAAALTSEQNANSSAGDAEAWAVGTRFTVPVPPTTEQYQNNSKWWAEKAKEWYDAAEALLESLPEDVEELLNMYETLAPLAEEETLSGNVVTFESAFDGAPVKQIIVNIDPVQAGSGTPTPDNVRAITGWTGATIYQSGTDTSNPDSIYINWISKAGTVYGGTLTMNADGSGELIVNRNYITLDNTLTWSLDTVGSNSTVFQTRLTDTGTINDADSRAATIGDRMPFQWGANPNTDYGHPVFRFENSYIPGWWYVYMPLSMVSTLEEFTAWLANNPIHICSKRTPITYALSPAEVKNIITIKGVNNVWADTGNITITVGGYVETITAQMATKTPKTILCANEETGTTASKNYAVNDFLIWNNQLYRVTAIIAQGATLTEGTNITATTITAEITSLLNT